MDPVEKLVKPIKIKLAETPKSVNTNIMKLYIDDANLSPSVESA